MTSRRFGLHRGGLRSLVLSLLGFIDPIGPLNKNFFG